MNRALNTQIYSVCIGTYLDLMLWQLVIDYTRTHFIDFFFSQSHILFKPVTLILMRKLVFLQRSSSVAIKLLARIVRLSGLHLNERNFTQTQHPCCESAIPLQKQTMSHLFYSAHLSSSQCHFQITQNVTVIYFCVMFSGIQARCHSSFIGGQ